MDSSAIEPHRVDALASAGSARKEPNGHHPDNEAAHVRPPGNTASDVCRRRCCRRATEKLDKEPGAQHQLSREFEHERHEQDWKKRCDPRTGKAHKVRPKNPGNRAAGAYHRNG